MNLSSRDLKIFLTTLFSAIFSRRFKLEFIISFNEHRTHQASIILLHSNFFKFQFQHLKFGGFHSLSAFMGYLQDIPCLFGTIYLEILLNSSRETTIKMAFNPLLLKLHSFMFSLDQLAKALLGCSHPISVIAQTSSSKDLRKALIRSFQYAQLL